MSAAYNNEAYHQWFNENIYNLAKNYASKHPVSGMDKEDYVQELVTRVWEAMPKYNPKKSRLTTFAFLWFGSKRYELTALLIRRQKAIGAVESLEEAVTESGCTMEGTIAGETPDYPLYVDEKDAYSLVGRESKMFYEGYTLCQIAHICKEPLESVQRAIEGDIERVRKALGAECV